MSDKRADMREDKVWINSQPSVDGSTYVVTIEHTNDRAITLEPDSALRYASTVLEAAQRAEYDAAVYAQMRRLVGIKEVGLLINDLRQDRPPLDQSAIAPMSLEPGVNSKGKPFLALLIDGKQVGQWTVAAAREHAMFVLETVFAADLDSGYYRLLTGVVGLDEARARNVIGDLAEHRPS